MFKNSIILKTTFASIIVIFLLAKIVKNSCQSFARFFSILMWQPCSSVESVIEKYYHLIFLHHNIREYCVRHYSSQEIFLGFVISCKIILLQSSSFFSRQRALTAEFSYSQKYAMKDC